MADYFVQIFDGFCEFEEDYSSVHHQRRRRAIDEGNNPLESLLKHENV